MGCHQDILNQDWKFVNVVAMPFLQSENTSIDCCDYCRNFIVGKQTLENLTNWSQEYIGVKRLKDENDQFDQLYSKLYNRIIGFMSVSDTFGVTSDLFLTHQKAGERYEQAISGERNALGISSEKVPDDWEFFQKVNHGKELKAELVVEFD